MSLHQTVAVRFEPGVAAGYYYGLGNLMVTIGDRRILGQCERSRDGIGYGSIETLLTEACMGLVGTTDGALYAMARLRSVALLKGEWPAIANVPRFEPRRIATVANAIAAHDFLAFRRDRGPIGVLLQPEFYACST